MNALENNKQKEYQLTGVFKSLWQEVEMKKRRMQQLRYDQDTRNQ